MGFGLVSRGLFCFGCLCVWWVGACVRAWVVVCGGLAVIEAVQHPVLPPHLSRICVFVAGAL